MMRQILDAIFYTPNSIKTAVLKWTALIYLFGAITAILTAFGVYDLTAFQILDGTVVTWMLFLPISAFSGFLGAQTQKGE